MKSMEIPHTIKNNLLSGLLFCAQCGGRYFAKANYGGYKYYTCYSRARSVKHMIKADKCENKNWVIADLEAVIDSEVASLLYDEAHLDRLLNAPIVEKNRF